MKKVTLAIAMAALVIFAGCKKDNEINGTTLKASIEQSKSGNSKTSIVPVGSEAEIRWTTGDKIVVNNGTTTGTFTLTSGAGTTDGTFTYNGEYTFGDNNIAVYPETATISGNTVTVTMPAEQAYAAERNGSTPMLGIFTDPNDLTFTSLCGVLGISLKAADTDVAITAIEVVSKTDEKLNGTFTADATATGDDLKLVKSGTDGTNSVRFNYNTTLTTEPQNFYFAMPVGALANGFTLNVYGDGADPIFSKETNAGNQYTIALNQVNQMPTLPVALANVVDLAPDFEDGIMPEGWTPYGTNNWYVDTEDYYGYAPAYAGTYSLYVDGNGHYDSDYFVSPALVFDGSAASLSFAYATPDWEGDHNDLSVCYGTSPNGPWEYTSFVWVNSSSWTTATVDLSGLNGTYYIAFESYDGYGYCTAIDNINITGATFSRGNITATTNGNGAGIGAGEGLTAKPDLSAPARTRTNHNQQRIKIKK